MNKIAAAGTAFVVYLATASASWFVAGDRLWSGNDAAQVVVPAAMTVFAFVAGEGVLAGVQRLNRRSRVWSALLMFVLIGCTVLCLRRVIAMGE